MKKTYLTGHKLPEFICDSLNSPPRAGQGVHDWLFKVSRQLHAHLPAGEIIALLEKSVVGCGRHVPRGEIIAAVQNALPCAWQPKNYAVPVRPKREWPDVNHKECAAITRDGGGLADLWEMSAPRIEDNVAHTEEIIDRLFPGNPLLCCGKSQFEFDTRPRESWRGELVKLQFIVPSPMSAVTGKTKNGKISNHALANTGPRRFIVCEFDHGDADEQAALILHLATKAPPVCAVLLRFVQR